MVIQILVLKTDNTVVGIRCADHATPLYPQKLALISPTSGGRSVGIVCSRTKATMFSFSLGYPDFKASKLLTAARFQRQTNRRASNLFE
jgi:hypothetical protein